MTDSSMTAENAERLERAVETMRGDIAEIRHDAELTLGLLASLAQKIHEITIHDGAAGYSITEAPAHCPTCGSSLDHHPAPAGDLRICGACGWTQFVDQTQGALPPVPSAWVP